MESHPKGRRLATGLRWSVFAGLVLGGGKILQRNIGGGYEGIGPAILAMAAWLSACIIVYPDTIRIPLFFFHRLIDAIYLPRDSSPPPLDYKLANYLRDQGKRSKAVSEYLKIAHYYPQELPAYQEAIEVCLQCEDRSAAKRIYFKALRDLESDSARGLLKRAYAPLLEH